MTDPRYISPEIPGLIKYSNYGKFELSSRIEYTKEFIIKDVASKFDIPESDVWVISFNPTNSKSDYGIYWAAYVTIDHKAIIDKLYLKLKQLMMDLLRTIEENE